MSESGEEVDIKRSKIVRSTPYIPKLVVKLRDNYDLPYKDGVELYFTPQFDKKFDQHTVERWESIRQKFGELTMNRLITSIHPDRIKKGMKDAYGFRWKDTYKPPNFLTLFYIKHQNVDQVESLVNALKTWPPVEYAYIQKILAEPPSVARSPEEILAHDYHGSLGTNAEYAWWFAGGDGAGQHFIDMEQGWVRDHEDLPGAAAIPILSSARQENFRGHGTASLGVVLGIPGNAIPASGSQPARRDCVGIAPHITRAYVISEVDIDPNDPWNHDRVNAIATALVTLNPGHVLLLESHIKASAYKGFLPIEVEYAVYQAIEACTNKGIIVIEPAGNGNANRNGNLDGVALYGDSGAIMVAGAFSHGTAARRRYTRSPSTNYGTRINCFAWHDSVYTTGDGDQGTQVTDYCWFSGTSAASAMIAGTALTLQGIAQSNRLGNPARNYRYDPIRLRTLFSDYQRSNPTDPNTGNILSGNSNYNSTQWNAESIGVMPNMKAIIEKLGLGLDIYIRDSVSDTGSVPSTGRLSISPDIILRASLFDAGNPILDQQAAQAAYGQGSGNENNVQLGSVAVAGQPNYVYVRVNNRGTAAAANVSVTVFWSETATLVTPNLWQPAGGLKTVMPSVPVNTLTVSPAITWPLPPVNGHYCFVALVGNGLDPAPDPATFQNWSAFENFIRLNNNVAWRNFNVVNILPEVTGDWASFVRQPFSITGPHDRTRDMRLEVGAQLPPNSKLILKVPIADRNLLEGMGPMKPSEQDSLLVNLNINEPSSSKYCPFPRNLRSRANLLVHIPKEFHYRPHEVYIRQLYKDREVGRITWLFKRLNN